MQHRERLFNARCIWEKIALDVSEGGGGLLGAAGVEGHIVRQTYK
jgi:hypothetical protein